MRASARAVLLVGLIASPAVAQPGPAASQAAAQPAPAATADTAPAAPHHTPEPHDNSLSGHVLIAGSAALYIPTGRLDQATNQRNAMGVGPGFALDLGFGVAGNLVVGAWGQYAYVGAGTVCRDCSTSTIASGLSVAYHLYATGAFDPWAGAGLGYRVTSIGTGVVAPTTTYSGFEWLRLRLGANWYAFDKVGFGGFVELDGGTYGRKTQGPLTDQNFKNNAAHLALLAGVSIAFDSFGR